MHIPTAMPYGIFRGDLDIESGESGRTEQARGRELIDVNFHLVSFDQETPLSGGTHNFGLVWPLLIPPNTRKSIRFVPFEPDDLHPGYAILSDTGDCSK